MRLFKIGVLAGHRHIVELPAVALHHVSKFSQLPSHGIGLLLDQLRVRRLIGVPAQQHPLRRNDLIDHRTMKQLHVHPCRQLQQGIAPGGVVLKGRFYTVSKGSIPESLWRKLLHLGQSAVFIVGPAPLGFSQSDNHSRRQKACKGEDKHNICNFLLFHRAALLRIGSK